MKTLDDEIDLPSASRLQSKTVIDAANVCVKCQVHWFVFFYAPVFLTKFYLDSVDSAVKVLPFDSLLCSTSSAH